MSESAVHLVEEVLPIKPLRQWVLSFPIAIRLLLAVQPKTMSEVLNIATRVITGYLCKKAGLKKSQTKTGAVTLIQRFGGSINLNIHFHQLFLDGVYELDHERKPDRFHTTESPSQSELIEILDKIMQKIAKHLERRGLIVKDEEDHLQLDLSQDDTFTKLQTGAATYRFALGPNKGKKALTLKTTPDTDHATQHGLVAKNGGFSLHAGVTMTGAQRNKIEKLCRYIARPAVALERLSFNHRGQVVYTLKKPYDDGTTAIVMSPMELMERLAALVPRPRVHLTRFSGVFAPHYKYRSLVVPKPPKACQPRTNDEPYPVKTRVTWARLLKRVFAIDVENCHLCGAKMKIVACIEDPPIIRKILSHLGLTPHPPSIWSARGPPTAPIDEDHQQFPDYDFA